jgi:Zn-dependent metalloprotease
MKKQSIMLLLLFWLVMALPAADMGPSLLYWDCGPQAQKMSPKQGLAEVQAFFAGEIIKGNLILEKVQTDAIANMEHRRYSQFYKGIPVFGGQMVVHQKKGEWAGVNGEYFTIRTVEIQAKLSPLEAENRFKQSLPIAEPLELTRPSELCIFPVTDDDYRLAYRVTVRRGLGFSRTGLVDAIDGAFLLSFSNIKTEQAVIGVGTGYHNDQMKLALTQDASGYWMVTLDTSIRPVLQLTMDYHHSVYDDQAEIPSGSTAVFARDTNVNVHAYLGWVYDYYFIRHGRHGIDDHNMQITAYNHVFAADLSDNAFWSSDLQGMVFLDPLYTDWQIGAGLDVIGHELTHGVTDYTSKLIYQFQSGALNESFSDIMGTAIEFNFQPPGSGFNKADWVIGEDIYSSYGSTNYLRNLANPNADQTGYGPYPCHLNQYINLPGSIDEGGVHLNSTIFAHAFYLLANGGTNPVSHLAVSAIGMEKAARIYYRAFAFYLTQSSGLLNAANALLQSAKDLFGSSSAEYGQVLQSMLAIGFTA